jgi:putative tricarboxylic transport membrane protein
VSHSIADVCIMPIMGMAGYALRKFGFDPAPLVLGLVIAPMLEQSLRRSPIMSNGNDLIFAQPAIALAVSTGLLLLSALSLALRRKDWRRLAGEAYTGARGRYRRAGCWGRAGRRQAQSRSPSRPL